MLVNTRDALDRGWSIFSPFCFWFRAGTGLLKTESYQDAKNNSAIGVLLSAKVAHAPGGRLCQIILEVLVVGTARVQSAIAAEGFRQSRLNLRTTKRAGTLYSPGEPPVVAQPSSGIASPT